MRFRQLLRPALVSLLSCALFTAGAAQAAQIAASRSEGRPESRPEAGEIALTFDDLPALTLSHDQSYVDDLAGRILTGLKRHRMPATGFVVEGKLDELNRARQIQVLEKWLAAGMDLGNHTFSHESPNTLGGLGYIDDIAKGEPVTKELLARYHRRMLWFRHPYLETGSPEPVKREIDGWLNEHHYRIAPVTLNASDWEFAEPYDDAITHGNLMKADQIRRQYIDYTKRMILWYRAAAHAVFGRDIRYVMLLHATRLNADCIDDIAAMLREERLRPVTLARAMRDPAYRTADPYSGHDGIDWMERWSIALHKSLPWNSFRDVPKNIDEDYQKVDKDL